MINPMAQLEQWKASHQQDKINRFVSEMNQRDSRPTKIEKAEKTQQEAQGAIKGKCKGELSFNLLSLSCAQINRQFQLILASNQRCLENFPESFHHKLKMRAEMVDLIERLKAGGKLFNALAKSQGVTLTQDDAGTLKAFNQANGYLIYKFNEVIEQIDRLNVERVENEKLQGANDE